MSLNTFVSHCVIVIHELTKSGAEEQIRVMRVVSLRVFPFRNVRKQPLTRNRRNSKLEHGALRVPRLRH